MSIDRQNFDDDKLASLLVRWEDAWDLGKEISVTDLCSECPELKETIEQQIGTLKKMAWMKGDGDRNAQESFIDQDELCGQILAGRYQIEAIIGEGGFGRVYRAVDCELKRPVAIKISRKDKSLDDSKLLLEEARRVAKLQHPGIVSVHDVGRHDGLVFVVTELINGQNLAENIAEKRLNPDVAVNMVATISDALQFAHDQGFVHRDIKPANILLDHNQRPKIADFGIAASVDQISNGNTASSGTLPYMAPEQVGDEPNAVDCRTDIYALGVVLYEMLTGELPHQAKQPGALRDQILKQQPVPPRVVNHSIPKEVERICLRCLAKDPAHRYESATKLSDDLRKSIGSAVWDFRTMVLATIAIAIFGFLFFAMSGGFFAEKGSDVGQSLLIRLTNSHANSIAYSPDGRHLASGGMDSVVRLWDTNTGQEISSFKGHHNWIRSVVYSPNGKYVFSASGGIQIEGKSKPGDDHTIRMWSVLTGQEVKRFEGHTQPIISIAISADGKYVVSGSADRTVRIWSVETGEVLYRWDGEDNSLNAVTFSPDDQHVFMASSKGTVRFWDFQRNREVGRIAAHEGRIWAIAIAPNRRLFVTGGGDGTAILWTNRTKSVRSVCQHDDVVTTVAFSPDSTRFLTGSEDGTVRLWDSASGKDIHRFTGHVGGIWSVTFSPDGKHAASASNDGTIRFWLLPRSH